MKCNYLEEEICIKIGNIPKIFCWITILPAGKFTTLPWYMYEMSVQKKKIRKYSSPANSLNVGIYTQNWLSKVVQIYRGRCLYAWQQENMEPIYRLVFKRAHTHNLYIYIYEYSKTLMWMDTSGFPSPSSFSRIIAWHNTEILLLVLSKALREEPPLSTLRSDPCSGLVLFKGVFDLQQVSEARLPEEHGTNVVGNLFYSWRRKRRLWLLWTSPYLQEITDPGNFLWEVVWKLFTGPRDECKTVFSL